MGSDAPVIRHYVAGGREAGGGIGRLVGYILDCQSGEFNHSVTDTRGPRWNPVYSPVVLLWAMFVMASGRFFAPSSWHHLHIAGRGSTPRKLILGGWARLIGLSYVLHLHDFAYEEDFNRRPDWQKRAIRALFRNASHVIVLGRRDLSMVGRILDVPAERVTILRNCVPDPSPQKRRESGQVKILFLGQLGPRKGVPELLTALSGPAMEGGGWCATLAGDGPVGTYRKDASILGLADRVSFSGWLSEPDTRALCASGDILVLPSRAEGFAMAVLEGLAHGMAVVTTRVGAHDEVLEHGRHCLFVPVADPDALSETLAGLVADSSLRAALATGGRQLFLAEFRIDAYVSRLERLYSGLEGGYAGAVRSA